MTKKELKKLSRADLLELLIAQTEENERLGAQLAEANAALNSRQIILDNAGSIAEAALKLHGIFEAAQSVADQYLENVKLLEIQGKDVCLRREEACTRDCERRVKEAEDSCRLMEEEARRKCSGILQSFKKDMQIHWSEVGRKISLFDTWNDENPPADVGADEETE